MFNMFEQGKLIILYVDLNCIEYFVWHLNFNNNENGEEYLHFNLT